jgi:hypothetical protein
MADGTKARRRRKELIAAVEAGRVPASPRLCFDTVAERWSDRFEAMVAAGERHPAHLRGPPLPSRPRPAPRLRSRRVASLGVEDVAELVT